MDFGLKDARSSALPSPFAVPAAIPDGHAENFYFSCDWQKSSEEASTAARTLKSKLSQACSSNQAPGGLACAAIVRTFEQVRAS